MENNFLLRYPQKGDSLYNKKDSSHYNISLDPYVSLGPLGDNWAKYIFAYKEAADILVDKILNNRSIKEPLAFPTIFLYRQSIKLCLKSIICDGYELYDIKEEYDKIHKLGKLWQKCKEIILRGWPKVIPKEYYELIKNTENILKELIRIDPSSQESRYPESKEGYLTMEGVSEINIEHMKDIIDKVYNFLNDMGDAISIQLLQKRDT